MADTNSPKASNEGDTPNSSHTPVFYKTNVPVIDLSSDDDVVYLLYYSRFSKLYTFVSVN